MQLSRADLFQSSVEHHLPVLGGSWDVISGVRSPLLLTPLLTTHEPLSSSRWSSFRGLGVSSCGLRVLGFSV